MTEWNAPEYARLFELQATMAEEACPWWTVPLNLRSACLGFGFVTLEERIETILRGRGGLQGFVDRLT